MGVLEPAGWGTPGRRVCVSAGERARGRARRRIGVDPMGAMGARGACVCMRVSCGCVRLVSISCLCSCSCRRLCLHVFVCA